MNNQPPEKSLEHFINTKNYQGAVNSIYELINKRIQISIEQGNICMMENNSKVYSLSELYYCQSCHSFCKSCLQSYLSCRFLTYGATADYYCHLCPNLKLYMDQYKMEFLANIFGDWGVQNLVHTEVQKQANFENLNLNSDEAIGIINNFATTVTKCTVKKIMKISNPGLEEAFKAKSSEFYDKGYYGKEDVWHGTKTMDVYTKICNEGFMIGGTDVKVNNGTVFGRGVNASTEAQVCINYTGKTNHLLFCSGVIGNSTENQNQTKGFDSFRGPNVIVFFNSAQVIPRYLVEFK